MSFLKNWWRSFKNKMSQEALDEKNKRDLISDKRKIIIKALRDDLTTAESIDLFDDLEALFRLKMSERLVEVVLEKGKLEEFLK